MNEPFPLIPGNLEQDIDWTVEFLKGIQNLKHNPETKVKVVNLLVREEGLIQDEPRELAPR